MADAFFKIGEYGNTVSLYQRGESVYARYQGKRVRLGHITQPAARKRALAIHEALLRRAEEVEALGEYTLRHLLMAYRRERTSHQADKSTKGDELRVISLALAVFGQNASPSEIGEKDALRLHRLRTSGAIDSHGRPVPEGKRKTVSDSTASADIKTLRRMFAWGVRNGHITANRLDGLKLPANADPKRPLMTEERYLALRAVAPQVRSRFGTWQKWVEEESYLEVLLDLAWHTGHRISTLVQLREEYFHPDEGPYGALFLPAEIMKMNRDVHIPISEAARAAIDKQLVRERPNDWLFASPMKQEVHLNTGIARQWIHRAEELAKLDHLPGGGWHMFRRGFLTQRKGMSEADLAALAGFKNPNIMRSIYQQPTFDDMVRIIQSAEDKNASS